MPAFDLRLGCITALTLLSLLPFGQSAQDPRGKPAASPIRVQTSEVVVDVNVTDGDGIPVGGLMASDFEVFEDGAKQQVVSFHSISPNIPGPRRALKHADDKAAQLPELVADTQAHPRLISLVIDRVNI